MKSDEAFEFMKQFIPTPRNILNRISPDYEKAKEIFDQLIDCNPNASDQLDLPCISAMYQAIKKQIPTKVRYSRINGFRCPCCDGDDYYLMLDHSLLKVFNHCSRCGQALDWKVT